jgi:hypothetical protein
MLASTAEWVAAGAGVFAAIGTVGALVVAVGLLRNEQLARRGQEEREARAQADLVSAWWLGTARFDPTERERERGAQTSFSLKASVHNGSDAPIYDVIVEMPRSAEVGDDFEPGDLEILRPRTDVEVPMLWRCQPPENECIFGIPSVTFTDTHGVRWRRGHRGEIARDDRPLASRWERVKAEGKRSDAWFDLWDENPYVRFDRGHAGFDDDAAVESSS